MTTLPTLPTGAYFSHGIVQGSLQWRFHLPDHEVRCLLELLVKHGDYHQIMASGDFPAMFQYQRLPMMSLGLSHDLLVGRWGVDEQKFTPRLGIVKTIHAYKRYKVRQSCPIIGISSLLESGGIPPLLHTCPTLTGFKPPNVHPFSGYASLVHWIPSTSFTPSWVMLGMVRHVFHPHSE